MEDDIAKEVLYDIRYSELSDGEELKRWLKDPDTLLWYPPDTPSDCENFVRNWIGFSKFKSSLTAIYQGKPIGIATIYLMPYIKVAHICMLYFIVDPEYRKRGVATSLLKNIKHLAKQRFRLESMHCELFGGAPAASVLEKSGFEAIIRQENFVDFPDGPRERVIFESQL